MRRLRDILFRVRALLRSGAMERDLRDEMAHHLERESEKFAAQGYAPEAAAAEARRRFGEVGRHQERVREAWGIGLFQDLGADVRHALRQFRRRPGFSVVAVLTLSLGIGVTVALLSVVSGLLLRPLPVPDEHRLGGSCRAWRGAGA